MEEDYSKSKKSFSNEINELHQYYEQRVSLESFSQSSTHFKLINLLLKFKIFSILKSFNDSNCSTDDRYSILFEQLQTLERRFDKQSSLRHEPRAKPAFKINGVFKHCF